MNMILRRGWILIGLVLVGCGTFATPVWQATTSTPNAVAQANSVQSAVQPTAIPTNTSIPPTATLLPTDIPTEEPTMTIESTAETVQSPIDRLVSVRNPDDGKVLFETFQTATGFACATCHNVASEERLVGPSLLNIKDRAETRVEGQSVAEYLYNSIINPDDYIVDSFPEDLMPKNWSDVYSDREIFDIVAYLLTLEGEAVAVATTDDTESDETGADVEIPSELPDTADAENGAVLFETFQPDAGFACGTCHHHDSEDRLIGPGLLNVPTRAETRVEGETAIEYIYTSITNPDAFVVPDYPDSLMPENWAEIYTQDEIFDIMAFLLTLEG